MVEPSSLIAHAPADKGQGSWESVRIAFKDIVGKGDAGVEEINPTGLTLEDATSFV